MVFLSAHLSIIDRILCMSLNYWLISYVRCACVWAVSCRVFIYTLYWATQLPKEILTIVLTNLINIVYSASLIWALYDAYKTNKYQCQSLNGISCDGRFQSALWIKLWESKMTLFMSESLLSLVLEASTRIIIYEYSNCCNGITYH